ncbi:hypothetical protein [Streptomyces sp. NPDC052015]
MKRALTAVGLALVLPAYYSLDAALAEPRTIPADRTGGAVP